MRSVLLILVRGYQWLLRPLLTPSCRFYPSCSCYAHEAISRFGALKGTRMTVARIARCHPWNPGGYDPVVAQLEKEPAQPPVSNPRPNQLNQI